MGSQETKGSGFETNRRAILKTAGVAAGAGTFGVTAGSVRADGPADRVLLASDSHLGSPYSNDEAFIEFLETEVPLHDPDTLVLAGDIFEQWWRGESSVFLEYNDVTSDIESHLADGIEVVVIAGNHDLRLVDVGVDDWEHATPGEPWTVAREYTFESGDTQFVAVHGDKPDPIQFDSLSTALCKADDHFGKFLFELYEALPFSLGDIIGEIGGILVNGADAMGGETDVDATGRVESVQLEQTYDEPVVLTSTYPSTDGPSVGAEIGAYNTAGDGTAVDTLDVNAESLAEVSQDSRVNYAVFEPGRYRSAVDLEVGRTEAGTLWSGVEFDRPFETTPVVVATVQNEALTERETHAEVAVREVTREGFEIRCDPHDGQFAREDVGYVAIPPGRMSVGEVVVDAKTVTVDEEASPQAAFDGPDHTPTFTTEYVASEPAESVEDRNSFLDFDERDGAERTVGALRFYGTGTIAPPAPERHDRQTAELEAAVNDELTRMLAGAGTDVAADLTDGPTSLSGFEPNFDRHEYILETLLDENPDAFVVFGHTHTAQLGDRWVNSGAWTSRGVPDDLPENTYVEIDGGDVTVWDWTPEGRSVLFD